MPISRKRFYNKEMEGYFFVMRRELREVAKAFSLTEGSKSLELHPKISTYSDFCQLPYLKEQDLARNPYSYYLPSGSAVEFVTSGTSGLPKKIFSPFSIKAAPFPPAIEDLIRHHKTVFVHSKRLQQESFYWIHDKTYRETYPDIPIKEYRDLNSAISAIRGKEAICIYEYPSAFYRFLFFVRKALEGRIIKIKEIPRILIVELSGEPVELEDLYFMVETTRQIFLQGSHISVTYGMNEVGLIGSYDFKHSDEHSLEYEVYPKVFVEIIDPESSAFVEPGEIGEIVITSLALQGTIIFRYRTGDKGILTFRNGKPYLQVLGKLSHLNSLFIMGSQFSVSSLSKRILKTFRIPISIDAKREIDKLKGLESLWVTLYVPQQVDYLSEDLEDFVRLSIIEDADLFSEFQMGTVNLKIRSVFIRFYDNERYPAKSWKISSVVGK